MTAHKELVDMPDDVRASAWCNRRTWYLKPAHWLDVGLTYALTFAVYGAWWVPAYWILFANLPIDAVTAAIPRVRNFIAGSYVVAASLFIFAHYYDIQYSRPRKDKAYPVLRDDEPAREMIRLLSYHVLGFAGLLLLASYMGSHGSSSYKDHLWPGLGMVGLGSGLLLFSHRPFHYGLRVPSESEVWGALRAREQRLLAVPMAAQDYATPVEKRNASLAFADMFGMQGVKDRLLEPGRRILSQDDRSREAECAVVLHAATSRSQMTSQAGAGHRRRRRSASTKSTRTASRRSSRAKGHGCCLHEEASRTFTSLQIPRSAVSSRQSSSTPNATRHRHRWPRSRAS